MELKEHLKEIASRHLPGEDYFLVDVILKGLEQNQKVLILIDGDNGVNIDACANLSRAMAEELELEELFPDKYTLEVSSPGIDHPIVLPRQFEARIGKSLKLTLKDNNEITGKLLSAGEERINIDKIVKQGKKQITEEIEVPLAEIAKAMVQVSFK